jgi:thioredoxin 1
MSDNKNVKNFTEETFQEGISKGMVLVDFNAVWCAPCRMLSPIIEQVAEHFKDKIVVAKVDIDNEQKVAAQFQVTSVPTIVLFNNGKEVNRLVGLRDYEALKDFVDKAI